MKVSRDRLSNQVYNIFKDMIANHRFDPGGRVNIEQITKEVGASRTPVWEAVHRLIQEGLLVNLPNRGVFMVSLSPRQAVELYTVREVLEGLAARLAISNTDQAVIHRMEKCLEEQRKVVQAQDLVEYSRLDYDFHDIVYKATDNLTLMEMLQAVKNKMRPISMRINPILADLYRDHLEIYQAFKEKNAKQAEAAFHRHNLKMIEQIKRYTEADQWKDPSGENIKTVKGKAGTSVSPRKPRKRT
jgi:DNA-binding GntR family transcriptional regulator